MKKIYSFLLSVFLLLIGSLNVWGKTYKLTQVTAPSQMTAGNKYVFERNSRVLNNTVTSKALQTTDSYVTSGLSGSESYVWTLEEITNSSSFYLRNVSKGNTNPYLDNKSNETEVSFGTNKNGHWAFSFSNDLVTIKNTNNSNRFLGDTGGGQSSTNQYKAYAASNLNSYGHDFTVYILEAIISSISVATAPTQTEFAVGEEFSSDGLTLTANYADGDQEIISAGFTFKIGDDDLEDGDALSTKGTKTVTISYGGQTCNQTIYVGELKSIAVTTAPTKTTYDEGQTFDPTGMVVTATYNTDDGHSWTTAVNDYTYDPTTALAPANTSVTISYGGKSTTQTITVNEGVPYTVTFNAGTGSCATASLTEASFAAGVELPTATIGVTGWSFAGWATASTANTSDEPTLYAAEDTYHPTDNVTLYAVYKYAYTSSTNYIRATSVSEITSAEKVVIAYNDGKVLNTSINLSTTLTETNGKVTPASNAIFTLSGDNTNGFTLTNGTSTIGTSGSGTSLNIALSSTNNLWTFSASTYTTNVFHVNNVDASKSLEVYNSAWKAYALTANGEAWSMRVYIPATDYMYYSNPADIVDPTVAFTNAANKKLYLQGETGYTNAATVTGISKTIEYTSSDATVATVSESGVVTALKTGTTTITASVAAEVGVNTVASASYTVTVKDASNIAGLKAITDAYSVVNFTADLTDAVVTYVNEDYAYIQDASGAVYASCGSSLTAGKKINGAVSGSIKAAYQIDEITAIDLTDATVTDDGDIPDATVLTVAQIKGSSTEYEGKLVKVNGATVYGSMANDAQSGSSIKDGSMIESSVQELNIYAPKRGVVTKANEQGSFTGFISIYNGSSYRLNIYEQSQISLTRNAPTAQTLAFENDEVILDEETSAYDAFKGQTVSGAQGTVSYALTGDAIGSINSSTGVVSLNGTCGTATITATAAAKEVTEAGVTTPYLAGEGSYSITVNPRYTTTFNINGVAIQNRQEESNGTISIPTPPAVGDYHFIGWSENAVSPQDEKPTLSSPLETPTANTTYYAVFSKASITGTAGSYTLDYSNETDLSTSTSWGSYGTAYNYTASDGSNWTIKAYKPTSSPYGMQINTSKNASIKVPVCPGNINSISVTGSTAKAVGLSASDYTGSGTISYIAEGTDATSQTINLSGKDVKTGYIVAKSGNIVISKIVVNYDAATTYSDYRTSLPTGMSITLSLTADTWATYCFPMDVTIPTTDDNMKVYSAKFNVSTNELIATPISGKIKAGEGVLLKSTTTGTNDYTFEATTDATSLGNENDLIGTLVECSTSTLKGSEQYLMILKKNENKFVRYEGASFPANKACLAVTPNPEVLVAGLRIVEQQNNATDLQSVDASDEAIKFFENGQLFIKKNGVVYDAVGRIVR